MVLISEDSLAGFGEFPVSPFSGENGHFFLLDWGELESSRGSCVEEALKETLSAAVEVPVLPASLA